MEIIYLHGSATAVDVMDQLPDNPVNATVRTMLNVLEEKGYLRHERMKGKYVYYPTIPLKNARKTLLDNVVDTFFKGTEAAAATAVNASISTPVCHRAVAVATISTSGIRSARRHSTSICWIGIG